jgi:hypothetical protein
MPEQTREVPEELIRLREAIDALERIEDDAACTAVVSQALREWPDYHARLRQLRELRVNRLRERKMTWQEIADVIGGITPERAQQIGRGLRGRKRPPAQNPRVRKGEDGDAPATPAT